MPHVCASCGEPLRLVWAAVLTGKTDSLGNCPNPESTRELCFPCFDRETRKTGAAVPDPSGPKSEVYRKPKKVRARR